MNKKKYTKYSQDYLNEVIKLVPKKNTTEKDDKGNIIDKPEIELLGEKRVELDSQITTLEQEIQTGKSQSQKAKDKFKGYRYIKKQRDLWQDSLDNNTNAIGRGVTYQTLSDNFRNAPANYDWDGKNNVHYGKNVSPTVNYTDNLYQLDIGGTNHQITEEQAINVMARVCHGLSNISDVADFKAKFASWDATNAGTFNTLLDNLIKDGKQVKKGQKAYDLTFTYTQHITENHADPLHNQAFPDNRAIGTVIANFYNWLNLVSGTKNVGGTPKTLAQVLTKDNTHTETIPVYGKGDKYNAGKLKEDYGITINSANQTLYKTSDTAINYPLTGGIGGWINFGNTINDTAGGNQVKLTSSFTASPNQDLFSNLRTHIASWNEKSKSWNNGTEEVGLEAMDDTNGDNRSIDEAEEMISDLKAEANVESQEVALTNREISKKKVEKTQKETERNGLDTKINKLIADELVSRRTTLATYKITDGFEDTSKVANGKDNRRTSADLEIILERLEDIRFLEKADTETDSTVDDENTAYTKLETLMNDFRTSKVFRFITVEGTTDADKCKKIKETSQDLQTYYDDYEKWEKLIKFSDKQKAEKTAIATSLGKQENPMETLKTYQDKLKALDPILTETIITQAIIDDWKTQNNFKTSATMEAELKKILKDGKLDDTFKTVMTKDDAEITDLAKLLQKKKAKEVITMIRRWEYDKLTDGSADKVKMVKTIKINMNKKSKDADPTDAEITTGLYKLAISEYSQKSESEITAWEKGENNDNTGNGDKTKWLRANNWQVYAVFIGIPVALLALLAVIFWEGFKSWWSGKKEDAGEAEARVED